VQLGANAAPAGPAVGACQRGRCSRSLFPARPRVTSVAIRPHESPSAFLRAPFLRDAAEGTDVPGCDEEISNELARRNGLVERRRGRGRMPTRGPAEAGW
jgi:hypothetical protein